MPKIKNFLNCKINFSGRVFQPRVETEFWVRKVIRKVNQEIENREQKMGTLDMFAGTGCIGVAVLKNIKNSIVDFVDISKNAIRQIKINLRLNRISRKRCQVYKSNLFEKLKGKKYDIIFANPPYVALNRISEVQKEVLQKEPPAALFGGKDGMLWIKNFLRQIKKHLNPRGMVYMEFDPKQRKAIKKILEKEGFKFQFRKDQFKKYRWLKASA